MRVDSLVFTPSNWDYPQRVEVVGRNQSVVLGKQNYSITLSPARSLDPSYDGVDPDDVPMKGLLLELYSNENPVWMTESQESFVRVETSYTGGPSSAVRYELLNAPAGMSIGKSGLIRWKPPVGSRGANYNFSVRAITSALLKQNLETQLKMEVRVSPSEALLVSSVVANELRVTDAGSSLNDVRFRFKTDDVQGRELRIIDEEYLPPLPSSVTRLTEVYYSVQENNEELEVLVPLSLLSDPRDAGRLSVFYRVNTQQRPSIWVGGRTARELETVNGVEYVVIKTRSLYGENFIGLRPYKLTR